MNRTSRFLTLLGVLGLVATPFAPVQAEEPDGLSDAPAAVEAEEGLMTAADSTARHLEALETQAVDETADEAAEPSQEALEHAVEVSAHGDEVVTAIDEGLQGQELAETASSLRELDHGPPGSIAVDAREGRPESAAAPDFAGRP